MKKLILLLLLIPVLSFGQDISLYNDLKAGMKKSEAKKILRKYASEYSFFKTSENTFWKTDKDFLYFEKNKLKRVAFYLRGTRHTSLENKKSAEHIKNLEIFFREKLNYSLVYKKESWNVPVKQSSVPFKLSIKMLSPDNTKNIYMGIISRGDITMSSPVFLIRANKSE